MSDFTPVYFSDKYTFTFPLNLKGSSMSDFPLILDAEQLQANLDSKNLVVIDLSQPTSYLEHHVPGAYFMDYSWITKAQNPVMGLLPELEQLNRVLSAFGINEETHIVAYDDEGGGRACRLLWTLDTLGHKNYSLLNGGIQTWLNKQLATSQDISWPTPSSYSGSLSTAPIADKQLILDSLDDHNTLILDCRSPMEYSGTKAFAARGGHIPGAVNMNWMDLIDADNHLQLKTTDAIEAVLESKGITKDKTIITHCQTHHRSSHSYIVLKSLGYEKIKGYPGSWSDWGNDPSTPIDIA